MAATVSVNGRITSARDAVISVFDHGFLYGETRAHDLAKHRADRLAREASAAPCLETSEHGAFTLRVVRRGADRALLPRDVARQIGARFEQCENLVVDPVDSAAQVVQTHRGGCLGAIEPRRSPRRRSAKRRAPRRVPG